MSRRAARIFSGPQLARRPRFSFEALALARAHAQVTRSPFHRPVRRPSPSLRPAAAACAPHSLPRAVQLPKNCVAPVLPTCSCLSLRTASEATTITPLTPDSRPPAPPPVAHCTPHTVTLTSHQQWRSRHSWRTAPPRASGSSTPLPSTSRCPASSDPKATCAAACTRPTAGTLPGPRPNSPSSPSLRNPLLTRAGLRSLTPRSATSSPRFPPPTSTSWASRPSGRTSSRGSVPPRTRMAML